MSFIWNILSTQNSVNYLLILLALFSLSVSETELTKQRGKAHSMSYKSLENLLLFHFNIDCSSKIIIRVKCLQISISQSISFFTFKMGIKGTFPVWFLRSWCLYWLWQKMGATFAAALWSSLFPQATISFCSAPVVFIPLGVKADSHWSHEVLCGVYFAHLFYHERIVAGKASGQQGGKAFAFKRKILARFSVQLPVCCVLVFQGCTMQLAGKSTDYWKCVAWRVGKEVFLPICTLLLTEIKDTGVFLCQTSPMAVLLLY